MKAFRTKFPLKELLGASVKIPFRSRNFVAPFSCKGRSNLVPRSH